MNIGFIGFGGAAYGLAKGLAESGVESIGCFDTQWQQSEAGALMQQRAAEVGAVAYHCIEDLVQAVDLVISCVTGTAALPVAHQAASALKPGQLYIDVNTAAPETMAAAAEAVAAGGAEFVDVAMMGAIPAFYHRVPCLASGCGAQRFMEIMQPYGMDITCVGQVPGQASAIKLFRSIFMKGFLALLLELLTATHLYQVDAVVLESLAKTMEHQSFLETVRLQLEKGIINAERMSHEMAAVVETLTKMGVPFEMSEAARQKLQWCGNLEASRHFSGNHPRELAAILDFLVDNTTAR